MQGEGWGFGGFGPSEVGLAGRLGPGGKRGGFGGNRPGLRLGVARGSGSAGLWPCAPHQHIQVHASVPTILRKLARKCLEAVRLLALKSLDAPPAGEPMRLPARFGLGVECLSGEAVERHLEERLDRLEAVVRAQHARVEPVADVDVEELAGEAEGAGLTLALCADFLTRLLLEGVGRMVKVSNELALSGDPKARLVQAAEVEVACGVGSSPCFLSQIGCE